MNDQPTETPRSGFTLLEMLVVIVIVAMLAALMFRMVGVIGSSNDEAKTRAIIERVSHALDEFKAIYGKYPPVQLYQETDSNGKKKPPFQPLYFEFPGELSWGPSKKSSERASEITKNGRGTIDEWGVPGKNTIYTFGLASFFLPRYNGTLERGPQEFLGIQTSQNGRKTREKKAVRQWTDFNSRIGKAVGDSDRDLDACRRILPFLGARMRDDDRPDFNGSIIDTWSPIVRANEYGEVTNMCYTIRDAWRRELHYVSRPPYDTYKLWSNGLNGINENGSGDDIVSGHF